MEFEDEENLEAIQLAQVPAGNVNSTKEVEARSWVQKTWLRCKHWFMSSKIFRQRHVVPCGIVLVLVIIALFVGLRTSTSYDGKFPHEQCPSKWIGYRKKCYFISEEETDWTSSQSFCTKLGALLVIFENQEEMHSLAKRLRIDDSWIGLRKKGESFYWENGTAFYANLFQIQNHSDCAYLEASSISTSACSLPRRSICIRHP